MKSRTTAGKGRLLLSFTFASLPFAFVHASAQTSFVIPTYTLLLTLSLLHSHLIDFNSEQAFAQPYLVQ